MREIIKQLIKDKPKHYSAIIQRNSEYKQWVLDNTKSKSERFVNKIQSAIMDKSDICKYGNEAPWSMKRGDFAGCGPAAVCQCTQENIAKNVSKTKLALPEEDKKLTQERREATMIEKYGVAYNSLRPDVKENLSKSTLPVETLNLLKDKEWMDREYNVNQRTLVDIAKELNVDYSTVGFHSRKHGFKIRKRANYSLTEKEVVEYVRSLGVNCEEGNWDILENKEIDIYIPALKLGIEINGLYWHSWHPSMNKPEAKYRHIEKTNEAQAAGVELLHFTDFDWLNKQDVVKSLIRSKAGLNQKIYARKCTISEVSTADERTFLDKNHLQGYSASSYSYGLYFDSELVMILTLSKSRFNNQYDLELVRLCSKNGFTIVGGFSKLMAEVKRLHNGKKLVSYCDLDFSDGHGYRAVGFTAVRDTGPGYFWTTGTIKISRHKVQKQNLKKWLAGYDSNKSQTQNMFDAGYRRYYNSGNRVFSITL